MSDSENLDKSLPSDYDELPVSDISRRNPIEKFFNISSTPNEKKIDYEPRDLVEDPSYDDKDAEHEKDIQEIFELAMTGYLNMETLLDSIEPKYRARMAEVALDYLKTGLSAANTKIKQKSDIDKLKLSEKKTQKSSSNTTNNIIFSGDRNDFLKQFYDAMKNDDAIEGELIDDEDNT